MAYNGNYTNVILEGLDRENPSNFAKLIQIYSERYTFGALKIADIRRTGITTADLMLSLDYDEPLNALDYEEYMNEIVFDIEASLTKLLGIKFKDGCVSHVFHVETKYRHLAIEPANDDSEGIIILFPAKNFYKHHVDALFHIFNYTYDDIDFMLEMSEYEDSGFIALDRSIPAENKHLIEDKLNKLGIKYEIKNHSIKQKF